MSLSIQSEYLIQFSIYTGVIQNKWVKLLTLSYPLAITQHESFSFYKSSQSETFAVSFDNNFLVG